jgi:hypothetical protein
LTRSADGLNPQPLRIPNPLRVETTRAPIRWFRFQIKALPNVLDPGFSFPKIKTEHRLVLLVTLGKTAGGALAELGQRLVAVAIVRISFCLKKVKTLNRITYVCAHLSFLQG